MKGFFFLPVLGILSVAIFFVNGPARAFQTFPSNPVAPANPHPKQQPQFPDRSLYFLGVHRYTRADYYGALDAFKRFVPLADTATLGDTYSYMGDAYSGIGDYSDAVAAYTKYLVAHPGEKTNTAMLHRGLAYKKLNRNAEAAKDLEAWRISHPEDPRQLRLRGLTAAVAKDPGNVALRTSLAKLQIELMDNRGALEQYIAITAANPEDAAALYHRGLAYGRLYEAAKAAADLGTYTRMKPEDASGWNYLGIFRSILKDYKGSIEVYDRCIALMLAHPGKQASPEFDEIFRSRGYDYLLVQDRKNTYADFARYLADHPDDYRLKEGLARVAAGDDFDEEISVLLRVVKVAPGLTDPNPWFNLGIIYYGKQRLAEATDAFTRSNDLKADSQTLFNRALAFYGLGKAGNSAALAQAEKDVAAALVIKPDYADAVLIKADTEFAGKKKAQATVDYQQYLGLPGVSAENRAYVEKQLTRLAGSSP